MLLAGIPLAIGLALLHHAKTSVTKNTVSAPSATTAPASKLSPNAKAATSMDELVATLTDRVDEIGAMLSMQQRQINAAMSPQPSPPAPAS